MYKILPILLFAFLIAEEKSEPLIIQSDSLDFIWAWEKLDETMEYCIERVGNIIDRDKFMMIYHGTWPCTTLYGGHVHVLHVDLM